MSFSRLFAFVLVSVVTFTQVSADEGMWVFNNLPKKVLKDQYSFEPSDSWAQHLMKSSVRFSVGGSGSFISSDGLVLTNHHIGGGTLHAISTPTKDYFKDGFYAPTQADEVAAPDIELDQLVNIEDVSDTVNAAVTAGMTDAQAATARQAAIAKIQNDSLQATGLRSDVVTLYEGGQYQLYRYERYTDVRLVFAPEFGAAFFGGDPDNFEYPRFDLDMCIFRVYKNGKPLQSTDFLKWNDAGADEGELIFVSGHPGGTQRMLTVANLEYLRDFNVPYMVNYMQHMEVMLQQFSGLGAEQARRAQEMLFGIQNSRKVYVGRLEGLQDPSLLQQKQKDEYVLRAAVQNDSALQPLLGAWDKIADSTKTAKKVFVKKALLESGEAFSSQLFSYARILVRMAEEDQKPNSDRLPEYVDSNRPSLLQQLYSTAPIYNDLEEATLSDSLSILSNSYGEDASVVQLALQGQGPDARSRQVVEGTSLADPNVRKLIVQGGKAAIDASQDPMILLAKSVDKESRAARKAWEQGVDAVQNSAYTQIAKAIFAVKGTSSYPDATFTLRLSYGQVKGYEDNGKTYAPFTTLGGAFDHESDHGGVAPWNLPDSWHKAKANLNLQQRFNFVSTADIIGGNSGSPVVNKNGELVGLIFDGNIESLVGDYYYDVSKNRAIAVHAGAMREAMRKIYGAGALADEIGK